MTECDFFDAVLMAGNLPPLSIFLGLAKVMRIFAAIAVGHAGEEPSPIIGCFQIDLRYAWKIAASGIHVGARRRSELVKIDLLEEVQICLGLLALMRVAGVEDRSAIGSPGCAAAASGVLHAADAVRKMLAGFRVVKMQRALFAAVLGEADGDQFAIGRGNEPIHRHLSFGFDLIGIKHHLFRCQIVRRRQRDQQPLLLRRLELQGEQQSRTGDDAAV